MATTHSQVSPRTVWTIGINVLAMAAVIWVAWNTWGVISWILIALFLALALDPIVRFITRHAHIKRGYAVGIVSLATIGLIVVLAMTMVPMLSEQVSAFAKNAPGYLEQAKEHKWVAWAEQRFGLFEKVNAQASSVGSKAAGPIFGIVMGALSLVAASITILSLTIFMLLWGRKLFTSALQWFPPKKRARIDAMTGRMTGTVGGYITGTFMVSIMGGVVTAASLLFLGVPYFLPLGLAMIILGVIPWVGSAMGALLVVSTTFATSGARTGLIALGIFLVWQQVENRITPLIQSRTVKMNALLIAMVMLLGTAIAGLLGALLSIPIAGAVQVVLQDVLHRRKERWRAKELKEHLASSEHHPESQLELFERDRAAAVH